MASEWKKKGLKCKVHHSNSQARRRKTQARQRKEDSNILWDEVREETYRGESVQDTWRARNPQMPEIDAIKILMISLLMQAMRQSSIPPLERGLGVQNKLNQSSVHGER